MIYRVIVQPGAQDEADEAYARIAERSPERATVWFNGLQQAVNTLAEHPLRCPLAPESRTFGEDVRHLFYGRARGVYRIVFVVRGENVYVISIRHGARKPLSPDDLKPIDDGEP